MHTHETKHTTTYSDIHAHCPKTSCKGVILSRRHARPAALTAIEKYLPISLISEKKTATTTTTALA